MFCSNKSACQKVKSISLAQQSCATQLCVCESCLSYGAIAWPYHVIMKGMKKGRTCQNRNRRNLCAGVNILTLQLDPISRCQTHKAKSLPVICYMDSVSHRNVKNTCILCLGRLQSSCILWQQQNMARIKTTT